MNDKVDFIVETVRRLHSVPDDWRWFSLDAHNKPEDFIEVTGAVPVGVVSRGPNKGRPKWPKGVQSYYIRNRDLEDTRYAYQVKTGQCWQCQGDGVTLGNPCKACKGTGKPRAYIVLDNDGNEVDEEAVDAAIWAEAERER